MHRWLNTHASVSPHQLKLWCVFWPMNLHVHLCLLWRLCISRLLGGGGYAVMTSRQGMLILLGWKLCASYISLYYKPSPSCLLAFYAIPHSNLKNFYMTCKNIN